ncbi:MAG TPA: single-stranded DNA-binding protein [Dielma fastidiosa]|jgi:single-strand DNA-binding protein|nr:single-stranded DNA-binding protein [Dielma fastidiosa]
MLNRVVLVGRITKNPELRKTQSGLSTISFTVACNRRFTSQGQDPQADFINCVAWRQTADYMASYVKKGALLGVEGRIQTRNYEDQTGKRIYVTEVVCDSVQTLVRSNSEGQSNYQPSYQASAPADNNGYTSDSQPSFDDFGGEELEIAPDDLPF